MQLSSSDMDEARADFQRLQAALGGSPCGCGALSAATVARLGNPEVHLSGSVADADGTLLRLTLNSPVLAGEALRIELPESVLLGEVSLCEADAEGSAYSVFVRLQHALHRSHDRVPSWWAPDALLSS
jgi:hypothetical protein